MEISSQINTSYSIQLADSLKTIIESKQGLRVSQLESLRAFMDALYKDINKSYIVLPGGVGKSRVITSIIEACALTNLGAIMLTPSSIQSCERLETECRNQIAHIETGFNYRRKRNLDKRFIVCNYITLLNLFKEGRLKGEDFPVLIADEAHSFLTKKAIRLIEDINPKIRFGLTATPRFYEGKDCKEVFGEKIFTLPIEAAIQRKEIAPLRHRIFMASASLDLDSDNVIQGLKFNNSIAVQNIVNTPGWNKTIFDIYKNYTDIETDEPLFGQSTFAFSAGVKHAQDFCSQVNIEKDKILKDGALLSKLKKNGVDPGQLEYIAAPVWGEQDSQERELFLKLHREKKILILASDQILKTSLDAPYVSCILNMAITASYVQAGQGGYRGSRYEVGKNWYVLDVIPQNALSSRAPIVLFNEFARSTDLSEVEGIDLSKVNFSNNIKKKPQKNMGNQMWKILSDKVEIFSITEQLHKKLNPQLENTIFKLSGIESKEKNGFLNILKDLYLEQKNTVQFSTLLESGDFFNIALSWAPKLYSDLRTEINSNPLLNDKNIYFEDIFKDVFFKFIELISNRKTIYKSELDYFVARALSSVVKGLEDIYIYEKLNLPSKIDFSFEHEHEKKIQRENFLKVLFSVLSSGKRFKQAQIGTILIRYGFIEYFDLEEYRDILKEYPRIENLVKRIKSAENLINKNISGKYNFVLIAELLSLSYIVSGRTSANAHEHLKKAEKLLRHPDFTREFKFF